MRFTFSVLGITILFGSMVLAPLTSATSLEQQMTHFEPGVMPSQSVIAAAAEEAEIYLASLEAEKVSEPEPEPEPEPVVQLAEQQPAAPAPQPAAPPAPSFGGGGSPEVWMSAAGIAPGDWGYVDFIASRESGWNPGATNPSSGACGLIQAYPCSKVPGNGYDPVDNLRWASGYASGRYGGWAQAYEFWTANHWW